jgi:hypothetical protein
MLRYSGVTVGIVCAAIGCKLLEPYPGGGDPGDALAAGPMMGSPFDTGEPQEPLDDPPVDNSITISNRASDPTLAIPGAAFLVDLSFIATNRNVVGGGIRFPGSDEVQWTLIDALRDQENGNIQFGYVVDKNICDDIPNLCHEIVTEQFAVGQNGDEFVVSPGKPVRVVLQCATCESDSCEELLPPGTCFFCAQPQICVDYFDRCLAEGMPNAGSDEEDLFNTFFGEDGILWSTAEGCAVGEKTCEDAQENADELPEECGL